MFHFPPSLIKPKTVAQDCDLFGHRIIKTFNRFVCSDFIEQAKFNSKLAGIAPWKPKQFPYPQDFYARHNQNFFDTSKPSGYVTSYVWKTRRANLKCPGLEHLITSFKQDTVNKSANIAKRGLRIKSNLPPKERQTIRTVLTRNVGFDNSDKNFGPVLYSRDLYLKQCQMHLFDTKGTYEYTAKPKDLILQDVARRLKNLLNDCFGKESTTKSLAHTLTKWADDSVKRDRLANFYVIWKLHKKANAQGVRTRPISWISDKPSLALSSQSVDRLCQYTCTCADRLTQPDLSAGINVIPARTECISDIGRRCSPLPFN